MSGLLRVLKCNPNVHFDAVPADIVINSLLAVTAVSTSEEFRKGHQPIFNCIISNVRSIDYGKSCDVITLIVFISVFIPEWGLRTTMNHIKNYPTKKMVWLPSLTIVTSPVTFKLLFLLYHLVPAIFVDIGMQLKGSKIRFLPIYSKIYYFTQLLSHFLEHQWKFSNDNMLKVTSLMSDQDHRDFPCTGTGEKYDEYIESMVDGIRKYFFKENDADLLVARRKYRKLTNIRYIFFSLMFIFLVCSLYFILFQIKILLL